MRDNHAQQLLYDAYDALQKSKQWSVSGQEDGQAVCAGRLGSTHWMGWGSPLDSPQVLIAGDAVLTRGDWVWVAPLPRVPEEQVRAALAGRWLRSPLKRTRRSAPDIMPVGKILPNLSLEMDYEVAGVTEVDGAPCRKIAATHAYWTIGGGVATEMTQRIMWTIRTSDSTLLRVRDEQGALALDFDYTRVQVPLNLEELTSVDETEVIAALKPPPKARAKPAIKVPAPAVDVFRLNEDPSDEQPEESPWTVSATGLDAALGVSSHLEVNGPLLLALTAMDPALAIRVAFDSERSALVVRCENQRDAQAVAQAVRDLAASSRSSIW